MRTHILYMDSFGKAFVPKRFRPNLRKYFLKAGYSDVPYTIFGLLFWFSVMATIFIYVPFLYPKLSGMSPLAFFLWTFISWFLIQMIVGTIAALIYYFRVDLKIYKRTKAVEEMLPEYLNLVAVNLKGGMAFENALWTAIKPEFDVLAKEITMVSKSVMTGNDVRQALREFADKYDSPILKRSVDLLLGEFEGGGRIVEVIDSLVENLKKSAALKAELRVATTTYMIFISAIVIFIAPALFAVSYQLLEMITSFSSTISGSLQNTSAPLSFSGSVVSVEEFKSFSYFALGIIAMFSSMIVSIIEKGDIKGGLKYIPIFFFGSTIFYYIFSLVMSGLFSGIV